jgi:hypothetical protein
MLSTPGLTRKYYSRLKHLLVKNTPAYFALPSLTKKRKFYNIDSKSGLKSFYHFLNKDNSENNFDGSFKNRRHDAQYNDIQYTVAQHSNKNHDTQHGNTQNPVLLR